MKARFLILLSVRSTISFLSHAGVAHPETTFAARTSTAQNKCLIDNDCPLMSSARSFFSGLLRNERIKAVIKIQRAPPAIAHRERVLLFTSNLGI